MDLSIIIPVYNTPPEDLRRCFASIRFPETIAFEVILVDDGSRSEAADFCRDYAAANPSFRYFRQENRGVSAARNTGLSLAEGRYVMFVDADDVLIPDPIQPSHLDGSYDMVFFDHEVQEGERTYPVRIFDGTSPAAPGKKELLSIACRDGVNATWARLYRRELLQEQDVQFPLDMVVAEDAMFVLSAILASKTIAYVSAPVYRYFHSYANGDSRLLRFPKAVFENDIRLYHARMEALDRHGERLNFRDGELDALRRDAAVCLIQLLFEAKGTLLVNGNPFDEISPQVIPLTRSIYQTWAKDFPRMTRLKCFLLKHDLKALIKGYSLVRAARIGVKTRRN